jgi:hypothetical protein
LEILVKSFGCSESRPPPRQVPSGAQVRGCFIDSVLAAIDRFYEEVIQNLKPWMPAPPKMRSPEETVEAEPVSPALISTAISSQDGPQVETAAPSPASTDAEPEATPIAP